MAAATLAVLAIVAALIVASILRVVLLAIDADLTSDIPEGSATQSPHTEEP